MVERKKRLIERKTILVLFSLIFIGILGLSFVLAAWAARAEIAAGAGVVNITSLVRYGNYSTTINVTVKTILINHSAITDSNFNVTLYCNKSGGPMSATTGVDLVKVITLYNGTNGNTTAGTGYAILSNSSVRIDNLFSATDENTLLPINCSLYAENTTSWAWSYGTAGISMNLSNLTFDSTPPSVNFSGITNTINNGNYTGIIVLNVSIIDQRMGIESVYFNISNISGSTVNWTKATTQGTSPSYYNLTVDLTGFPDGKYNLTVWANDTQLNNLNSTEYLAVIIDKTAPTGSISCSPSSVRTEDTLTCSCSATDPYSGVYTTVFTASPSTSSTGTFSETCVATDYAGNSATFSTAYTVESSGSGTSPSSSSSSTTTTEKPVIKSTSWNEITPTTPVTMTGFALGTGLTQIQIEVNSNAQNVQVIVDKYETKPANVSVSKANAYTYLHIETKNLADKLKKAIMKVQVEKSWVTEQGISKEEVGVFKFDESANVWNELTSTFKEEDATYYYYEVELNSFSYFAIAPEKVLSDEGANIAGTAMPSSSWVWIIVGLILLGLIVVGIVLSQKKKRR